MSSDSKKEMLKSILYLTQFGISIAACPLICIFGAIWLAQRYTLGTWIIFCGVFIGVGGSVCTFIRFYQKVMRNSRK